MGFCLVALERAFRWGKPEIFNTDQGCQFTSKSFTGLLDQAEVRISMDGKGRAIDNIWIERFWRSLKYEEVYLKDYESVPQAVAEMASYIDFYNWERPHQSLNYEVPGRIYCPQHPRWQLERPLKKSLELV
ncbi:MAG: transposase [Bradymonadaceae bacterium]|nr:transposase [Lujinxingiaceae bacterium]